MLAICFLFFVISQGSFYVYAEDISFEATVNSNKISIQELLELTLTVHGAKADISTIPTPTVDSFETRFVGPSTRFSMVNGVTSSEHSFIYNLFPSKVGHFQIPSIALMLEGHTYNTSPIDVEVIDKPVELASNGTASQQENFNDKVFMKTSIEPKEVYVGEKTPLMMKIYVKDLSLQLAAAPSLKPDGFKADATASMQKEKENINGMNYDTLRFDVNIYPTRSGDITVGPFQAVGDLIYRIKQNNDFFGTLLATEQTRPITLNAPAITLHAVPLPMSGKPEIFFGAVGQYDFKASVGPASVKVGDPLTLHMTISGQGYFKDLAMPVFNDHRFKIYDPQIKDNENSKTLEQVIIPTAQDIIEVPAISFSYFDPQIKRYKTITQGPFPVKVLAPAVGQEFKAYGFVDKTKSVPEKSFDFKFNGIRDWARQTLVKLQVMVKDWRFWGAILLITIIWFGWKLWQAFKNRLQNDVAFARRYKAEAKARESLKATKTNLQNNNSKEFYTSLYKTLNDYLADKMHVPLAGLNGGMIEAYLKERSVEPSKLQTIKILFEHCDLVRFASVSMSQEQMQKDYEQLQDLMGYLPRILK